MNCVRVLGICLLAAGLVRALPANARGGVTWSVTAIGEPSTIGSTNCAGTSCPTLRDAINTAASGDTITFDPAINRQTILLTLSSNDTTGNSIEFGSSAFLLADSKSLTIDGAGHGITIARDPSQPAFRLFDIDSTSTLTLRGLTLRNGLAQGGSSNGGGGALGAGGMAFNQGVLTIDSCTLDGNSAHGGRGGSGTGAASGGAGVGQDATSTNGGGPNGGAAGAPGRNGGFGGGGGFDDGSGGFGGGGSKGTSGDTGGFGGGGGGNGTNITSTGGFGGGHSGGGGGNLVPVGGSGGGMGGAIFNDAGTLTLTNATLYGNSAIGGNATGGNFATAGGNGSGMGGAIFNYAGTLSLSFVTLSANSTSTGTGGIGGKADGGAIYSYGDFNCGVSDGNSCPAGNPATLTLANSIAARSVGATNDVVVDSTGGISTSSGAGNLIMKQSGFSGTMVSSADPKLGSPTPYPLAPPTLPIPATSPAYNGAPSCMDAKGQVVALDERGVSRPQSASCDIGAYEFNGDYIFANGFD